MLKLIDNRARVFRKLATLLRRLYRNLQERINTAFNSKVLIKLSHIEKWEDISPSFKLP
jgi:hypothetical protein